jgi:Zn-dependent protease with chaperone function
MVIWSAAAAAAVVFSYVLTLALGLGLLGIGLFVVAMLAQGNTSALTLQILLGAFGLMAGASVLWALVPRKMRFDAPGAAIDLTREPRLKAEIERIAGALDEPMPTEVYLIADANAFVAQPSRGRKVLAIGLPLMQTLTIAELRALLAHEFAHFYSGDTRLGPWVYRGRATMVRVFENLGKKSGPVLFLTRWAIVAVVYRLLIWFLQMYWKLFLRLTQLISRRQEFRSDEIACYVAGSGAMAAALESINRTGAVVAPYWQTVVFPMAARGYQARIGESFSQFLEAPQVAKVAADYLEKRMTSTKSDPFDTHPPLGARISEAKKIGAAGAVDDAEDGKGPAISLLENVRGLESALLCKLMPKLDASRLKPLDWGTCGPEIFVPMWRTEVAPFLPALQGVTLMGLPTLVKDPRVIAERVLNPPGILLNKSKREARALEILRMALAVSLVEHGWVLRMAPAVAFIERDGVRLVAGEVVSKLKSGAMLPGEWEAFCVKEGVGGWMLVGAVSEEVGVAGG